MNSTYSSLEVESIRRLVLENDMPDDSLLLDVIQHDLTETKNLIKRHLTSIKDLKVSNDALCSMFNDPVVFSPRRSPRLAPKQGESPKREKLPQHQLALPPKYRGKSMSKSNSANKNENGKFQHTSQQSRQPKMPIVVPAISIEMQRIPMLPKCENVPAPVSRRTTPMEEPKIGSLAAILHPSLGPAYVCRVLGSKTQNQNRYYLVSFFQNGFSPCYVPREYLFQLKPNIGFPLGNEIEFNNEMKAKEISLDFLLERIYSSAQNIVINNAEVLFPPEKLQEAKLQPQPQQVQQVMFQCVTCAALILVCYVSCQWNIPSDKLPKMLSTIMNTNPSKYSSTNAIMNNTLDLLDQLLGKIETNY